MPVYDLKFSLLAWVTCWISGIYYYAYYCSGSLNQSSLLMKTECPMVAKKYRNPVIYEPRVQDRSPGVVALLCFFFLFMQTKYMHRIKFIICSRCGNVLPLIRYVAELRTNDLDFLTECQLQCTRVGTPKITHTSQKTTLHCWNKKV